MTVGNLKIPTIYLSQFLLGYLVRYVQARMKFGKRIKCALFPPKVVWERLYILTYFCQKLVV